MKPDRPPTDLPVRPAPDPVDPDLAPLLQEPFASAWAGAEAVAADVDGLRQRLARRLADRLAATRLAEAGFTTVRRKLAPHQALAPGVSAQTLYQAAEPAALLPGEPLRVRLLTLAPGACWPPDTGPDGALPQPGLHREWLVMSGSARVDGQALAPRDYHVQPAGQAGTGCCSDGGAMLFLRESALPALPGDAPLTVRDAEAGWPDFAPGIQRRVLWQRDGQAALLYHAQPGAQVPTHTHGHDEECLMVQGELFLDDLLLQPGDYQLAPAGSGHRITETDTGVVIYAHGDLDLRFVG